jgi:beta-glucosidase
LENLPDLRETVPELYNLQTLKEMSGKSFESLIGRSVPKRSPLPVTKYSTLKEIRLTWLGRKLEKAARKAASRGGGAAPQEGQDLTVMLEAQVDYIPIFALVSFTGGVVSFGMLDGIIMMMNGRYVQGVIKVIVEHLRKGKKSRSKSKRKAV